MGIGHKYLCMVQVISISYHRQQILSLLKSVSFKKTVEISSTWEICTKFTHMTFVVITFLYVRISAFKAQSIIFVSVTSRSQRNRLLGFEAKKTSVSAWKSGIDP